MVVGPRDGADVGWFEDGSEHVDTRSLNPNGIECVNVLEKPHLVEVSERKRLEPESAELPGEVDVALEQYGVDAASREKMTERGARDPRAEDYNFRVGCVVSSVHVAGIFPS